MVATSLAVTRVHTHSGASGPLRPPGANRVLQGIPNGVFAIVNNAPVRIHAHRNTITVVERQVRDSEVALEMEKLRRLSAFFVSEAPSTSEQFLAKGWIEGERTTKEMEIPGARRLVETDKINPEAAVYRLASQQIKALKDQVGTAEKQGQALRKELRGLSDRGLGEEVSYGDLEKYDQQIGALRVLVSRLNIQIQEAQNLMERMIVFLLGAGEEEVEKGVVHVADNLSWSEIKHYFAKGEGAGAFVLNSRELGPASHLMIYSHDDGIPLVPIREPLRHIDISCQVSVDSRTGQVIVDPTETTIEALEHRRQKYSRLEKLFKEYAKRTKTLDGKPIPDLKVNIKDRSDLAHLRGQSVGLDRTEGLYTEERPIVQSLVRYFKDLFRKVDSVNIRLFDVASDKIPAFFSEKDKEEFGRTKGGINFLLNTETGWSILIDQLKAVLIACDRLCNGDKKELEKKDICLTIPMVTNPDEVRAVRKIIAEVEADLMNRENPIITTQVSEHIKIGVMVETAAAVANIEELAEVADRFSLGANDLTQDLLGFPEQRKKLMTGKQYDWLSPIVLRNIKKVIDVVKSKDKKIGSCGEMSRDTLAAIVLTLMGTDWMSMDESWRLEINYVLAKLHLDEWGKFSRKDPEGLSVIERILKLEDAMAVREFLFNLINKEAHADTKIALEDIINSATPITYMRETTTMEH